MKSLDKDRRRRYESPGAVAADVRRFLEDLPIEAAAPTVIYRMRKFARRNRSRLISTCVLALLLVLVVAAFVVTAIQQRKELADAKRQIGESLASARTAIAAQNLGLAETRLAEATTLLRQASYEFSSFAIEIAKVQDDVVRNRTEQERFTQFIETSRLTLNYMFYERSSDRPKAEEVLALYGVLTDANWQETLASSSLNEEQKDQVRQTAYTALLCLADSHIRWRPQDRKKAHRCLGLLQQAEKIREPTRGFYWVRSQANGLLGDTTAKQADLDRMKTAPVYFAWDYFLEGHTGGWNDDVDVAVAAYRNALRIEPAHLPSLFFLGMQHSIMGDETAIGYFTACLAVDPDHQISYVNRGYSYFVHKNWEETVKDITAALNIMQKPSAHSLFLRAAGYDQLGQVDEARLDRVTATKIMREALESSPEKVRPQHIEAIRISAENCSDIQMEVELWHLAFSAAKSQAETTDSSVAQVYAGLGYALHKQGELSEAERTLREGLALYENKLADDWSIFQLTSYLGAVKAAQGRPEDAEPLLTSGYEGMRDRQYHIRPEKLHNVTEAKQRLMDFYEATGRTDDAKRWQLKSDAEAETTK